MKITDSELKLLEIIWEDEPIKSGELVIKAFERYDWKKSTVYTILKKLVTKGAVNNDNALVTSVVSRETVTAKKTETIKKSCGGSLPMFITAFLDNEKLTKSEAEELKRLIDSFTED